MGTLMTTARDKNIHWPSRFYDSGYAALFGVVINLGSNAYILGDARLGEQLSLTLSQFNKTWFLIMVI